MPKLDARDICDGHALVEALKQVAMRLVSLAVALEPSLAVAVVFGLEVQHQED